MVNTGGQLYTIEGIAAALIIILTAIIVVNSTSVYTMGDTHISDMQLEVVGNDALSLMNTESSSSLAKSPLQTIIETDDGVTFRSMFLDILNARAGSDPDHIQFSANVTYVEPGGTVNSSVLSGSSHPLVGGEHPMRASKWLIVDKKFPGCAATSCMGKHAVLVEVLLWRD